MWAFATAGVPAPALFAAMAEVVAPRLRDFKPQELANMAWACATAGVQLHIGSGSEPRLRHRLPPRWLAR